MSDSYIDLWEVGEYGPHFVTEVKRLVGASKLVDINALSQLVQDRVDAVASELEKAGISRSNLRSGRRDTAGTTEAAADAVERFYHHVQSLPRQVHVDVEAFFPGKVLGSLSRLKPADIKAKADAVLRGFAAPVNAALTSLVPWHTELAAARDALDAALKDKGSARGSSILGTAALTAARAQFVSTYNGTAKHLVQAVLNELGRSDDYPLFFLDLQVNEDGSKKPAAPTKPATPPAPATSTKPAAPPEPATSTKPAAPPEPATSTKPAAPPEPAALQTPAAPPEPDAPPEAAASHRPTSSRRPATLPEPAAPHADSAL